ncbi:MAG: DNA mismatch repair protein MutS [Clostridia bacterium]
MMALTPMMQQYLEIKDKHQDCILFFRLGDFYEMFYDDAKICSKELELTLTGKDCGMDQRAPMCGIPYHSAKNYLIKLIEKDYKVAICEQVEDPAEAKGIVRREVIKILTPGTIIDNELLEDKKNNYIACIFADEKSFGIGYADISTGEAFVTKIDFKQNINLMYDELIRINPNELIITKQVLNMKSIMNDIKKRLNMYITVYDNYVFPVIEYNIEKPNDATLSLTVNMLFNYIHEMQKNDMKHMNKLNIYEFAKCMILDASTRKNLELLEGNREKTKKGSLLWVLDKTVTAMGGRLIRKWIETPLINKNEIEKRHQAVECIKNDVFVRDDIIDILSRIYDIERIITKIVSSNINARDLIMLKNSLQQLPVVKEMLATFAPKSALLEELYNNFDVLEDISDLIERTIVEDPPLTIKEGNLIKQGYNQTIDEYKFAATEGKNWLLQLENDEKEKTGIKNLKVGYNRIFGYYLEVTKSYLNLVPEARYMRKQTLAGAERYITEELKNIEEKILGSQEKLITLEYNVFTEIREKVASQVVRVQRTANILAVLDVVTSFALVAEQNNYVRPEICTSGKIDISMGRHPVVEKTLKDTDFVPNDTLLDNEDSLFAIVTGPNMAGKSTYMRQTALIVLMAQIGCFVPASSARITVVDRIFTRVGASDDLAMGQSTFMVEMQELANILENATNNSLIILDEIGRGTSTYDGLAIAWATVEYIAADNKLKAKTLFATHYHELTELENKIKGVKNYSIEVREKGDDVIFLRRIIRGSADESYGIYVAKLAGVPNQVIKRAKELLKELEKTKITDKTTKNKNNNGFEEMQMSMFNFKSAEIIKYLEKVNLEELSPKEALDVLYKLKDKM